MPSLNNPELQKLDGIIAGLALNKAQSMKISRAAVKAMRKNLRKNLKDQKDIHGNAFKPRSKVIFIKSAGGKISQSTKMFRKTAKAAKPLITAEMASLGFSGGMARIVKSHNFGSIEQVNFSGGARSVNMPKREFLGWSDEMKRDVQKAIIDEYLTLSGATQ